MPNGAPARSRRYAIRSVIGKGGMGVVYRAYDNETRREVAIKTLLDLSSSTMLDLFRKECEVLARLNHPNIVDIYDIGEFTDETGKRQPYFVMPLLPGVTLDRLIADGSYRLAIERVVDIISQAGRGLHAAHERGLVHRDIKPSNIFVLEDDSVKLIDFGVAHLATGITQTTIKGTLHYMAPEQVEAKKPTPLSDLFSLAVVCYEALARRRPFEGEDSSQVIEAILHQTPRMISEFNPAVNRGLSQVIQKALAKHPMRRFATVREFCDMLQKAASGQDVGLFDEARMKARLERARKALADGEMDFANELLTGMEDEGYAHPDLGTLRREVDRARRENTITQLIERARRCCADDEPQLALQKIQQILEIEPAQQDALALQREIENRRNAAQIGAWMTLANQHLDNQAYGHARQALEDVLRLKPDHTEARKLLALLQYRQAEHDRVRKEEESRYQAALEAWNRGEISAALLELERVMSLLHQAPDKTDPGRGARFQNFYEQVRSEHDALRAVYEQARHLLAAGDYKKAMEACEGALAKYPGQALLQALKVDIEEAQRQSLSAFIAKVDRDVEAEPDLDRRVSLLQDALAACPGEAHFERALALMTSKRDLVNGIVLKARRYEESRQFGEALNQWSIVGRIYPGYPGLSFEIERLVKRRDQRSRAEAKARHAQQIDESLGLMDWTRALDLVRGALVEFPGDGELKALEQLAIQGHARAAQAAELLEHGRALYGSGDFDRAIEELRKARQLEDAKAEIAGALADALLAKARPAVESDPDGAAVFVAEALQVDPAHTAARTLRSLLEDRKRERRIDELLSHARQLQVAEDIEQAIAALEEGLRVYPGEGRLVQLKTSLEARRTEQERAAARRRDLEEGRSLEARARETAESEELRAGLETAIGLAARHTGDKEFDDIVAFLRARLQAVSRSPEPAQAVPPPAAEPAPAPQPPPEPQPAPAAVPPVERRLFTRQVAVAAACVGIVILTLIAGIAAVRWRAARSPADVAVAVATEPAGAAILVDGSAAGRAPLQLRLSAGAHRVAASAAGYQAAETSWDVKPGFAPPALHLAPLPARLQILSDLPSIQPLLDGNPTEPLAPGAVLDIPQLPVNAQHRAQFSSAKEQAEVVIDAPAARVPELRLQADSTVLLLALASFGSSGRIYSSVPLKVSVDGGKSYAETRPQGLDLPNLPQDGTLTVQQGDTGSRTLVVTPAESAPGIAVFLLSSTPTVALGSIGINAPDADFNVLIDGRRFGHTSKGPPFLVYNVPEGSRKVVLQKTGYRIDPAAATAAVNAGARASLKFSFTPLLPRLAIRGGTPEARVVIGPRSFTVDGSGDLAPVEFQPGDYTVTISKEGYRNASLRRTLHLGDDVVVGPPESRLSLITGSIRFSVGLAQGGVRLEIVQTSGLPMEGPHLYTAPPSGLVVLPVGKYTIHFSATGCAPDTVNVDLPEYPIYPIPFCQARR